MPEAILSLPPPSLSVRRLFDLNLGNGRKRKREEEEKEEGTRRSSKRQYQEMSQVKSTPEGRDCGDLSSEYVRSTPYSQFLFYSGMDELIQPVD